MEVWAFCTKKQDSLDVEVYIDSDWVGSIDDRRSTTGYCAFLARNLVTWMSKKQNVVAQSSIEAKFRALAKDLNELLWIKLILKYLKIGPTGTARLYCDNKSAISLAHNPLHNDRTKHIEIDRHFIKEKVETGEVCIPYVPTKRKLANVFTKGLDTKTYSALIDMLRIIDIYSPT